MNIIEQSLDKQKFAAVACSKSLKKLTRVWMLIKIELARANSRKRETGGSFDNSCQMQRRDCSVAGLLPA